MAAPAGARPLRASLEAALAALPPASPKTLDNDTLRRLRTCAALDSALARVRAAAAPRADAERVILAALLYVVDTLTHGAAAVHEAQWYWRQIESSPWRGALCWVQSTCTA